MRYNTISAIGSFTALSPSATDWLFLDPAQCVGGDDAPLRTNVEDAPGADGVLVFPPLDGAQIITLAGKLIIRSSGTEAGYFSAEDSLFGSLKSALDSLKSSPGSLVHSGGTLSVWKYGPIVGGREGLLKTVTFDLVVDA